MRVLIYSNAPWSPTGYGTQAAQLGRSLKTHGHDVAWAAFHGLHGQPLAQDGNMVYPGSTEDAWAQDILPGNYQHFGADLLVTLMDIWVLEGQKLAGMNVAHWIPVDCWPLGMNDRVTLQAGGGYPVAISRFGQAQLEAAGFECGYAPHALDMDLWKPDLDRDKIRESLGFSGKFIVGVNSANQDPQRKGLGEQLDAFASFAARHPEALMLVHSRGNTRQGLELQSLIDELGMRDRIVLGDQYKIATGMLPEGQMVVWHNVVDVLSNCSWGEGFGLSALQAQAVGCPVIVTDHSAMVELCAAGWLVDGQRFRNRGHNAWWKIPFTTSIEAAYESAFEVWSGGTTERDGEVLDMAALRKKAREFALGYDSKRVFEAHWAPILGELVGG